jgi:hypothetical protein
MEDGPAKRQKVDVSFFPMQKILAGAMGEERAPAEHWLHWRALPPALCAGRVHACNLLAVGGGVRRVGGGEPRVESVAPRSFFFFNLDLPRSLLKLARPSLPSSSIALTHIHTHAHTHTRPPTPARPPTATGRPPMARRRRPPTVAVAALRLPCTLRRRHRRLNACRPPRARPARSSCPPSSPPAPAAAGGTAAPAAEDTILPLTPLPQLRPRPRSALTWPARPS